MEELINDYVECEIAVNKIFYPKYVTSTNSGDYCIFLAMITKPISGKVVTDKSMKHIKLKGNCPALEFGSTYVVRAKLEETNAKYGDTYTVLFMNKKINLSDKHKQKEFLSYVLTEQQVEDLFNTYDDVLEILDREDINALCKVKGIKEATAMRIIENYKDCKDYSSVYLELGQLGLTENIIKKVVNHYNSPDTAIDKIRNDPYNLIEVDGIGFKKADEIALKVGVEKFDIRRVGGYMKHLLREQGEQGRSWLSYDEIIKNVYDTLGYVPDDVISSVAKVLIDSNVVKVLDNGEKIMLTRFYNLEKNIAKELLRLMYNDKYEDANKKIEERKNTNDYYLDEEDVYTPYIPMDFDFSNLEDRISEINKNQGYELTDEQKKGIYIMQDNNVVAITGGAGCVDCNTEFLTETGWKYIKDYEHGDKVLQYNEDGSAEFVEPLKYIKVPCEYFNKIENSHIDQAVCDEHTMLFYNRYKKQLEKIPFKEFKEKHEKLKNGYDGCVLTSFNYSGHGIKKLTNAQIRLQIAIFADGNFTKDSDSSLCRINIKKQRKKDRLVYLLKECDIEYNRKDREDGYSVFSFYAPLGKLKSFPSEWYHASKEQLTVISDEVLRWDGNEKDRVYYTSIKKDADFVQFVFSSLNYRTSLKVTDRVQQKFKDNDYIRKSLEYRVFVSKKQGVLTSLSTSDKNKGANKKKPIEIVRVSSQDGYKYCFTMPSGMFVIRRNNKINVIKNCGKSSSANAIMKILNPKNYICCALSGKASVRITEATGLVASTIHRALDYSPIQGKFMYDSKNQFCADVVLIDEATMPNGDLYLGLLRAIPTGAKVILMGDVQQLTPIGNCQVFADILSSNIIPSVKLTKPHRQALKSGIIPTSINIAQQKQIFKSGFVGNEILGELQDMELDIYDKSKLLSPIVVNKYLEELDKVNGDLMKVQICVATRVKGDLSCYNLNTLVQSKLTNYFNLSGNTIEVVIERNKKNPELNKVYTIHEGDKVINVKNCYTTYNEEDEITPVFNGNIGIVLSIDDKGNSLVNFEGIGKVIMDKNQSKNLELAYALGCHKMQGSSGRTVIVGIDNGSYIMNTCELLYTAITRAEKYCVLIAHNNAIKKCISNKEVNKKQTLLQRFLLENKTN